MSFPTDFEGQVLAALPVPIVVVEVPSGIPVLTNELFEESIGKSAVPKVGIEHYQETYGLLDREGEPYPTERMPIVRIMETGGPVENDEMVIRRLDGSLANIKVWGKPLFDERGEMTHAVMTYADITDAIALEERLTKIVTLTPIAVGISRAIDGTFLYVNQAFADLLGRSIDDVVGTQAPVTAYDTPSDRDAVMERLLRGGEYHGELWLRRGEGGRFRASMHALMTTLRGEACVLGTILDVTELHVTEDELRESLRQKEVLLREVHHRVKNNLQIVSSMLSLQSRTTDNPELQCVLRDCRARIGTIASIHEALYRDENLSLLRLDELFARVTSELRQALSPDPRKVDLSLQLAPIEVDIDAAIPAGLIVTELVSNALRHAFEDGAGRISVVLDKGKGGGLRVRVADDGVGMPETVEESGTLGLRLVRGLVAQLDGELQIDSAPGRGVSFEVHIPRSRA